MIEVFGLEIYNSVFSIFQADITSSGFFSLRRNHFPALSNVQLERSCRGFTQVSWILQVLWVRKYYGDAYHEVKYRLKRLWHIGREAKRDGFQMWVLLLLLLGNAAMKHDMKKQLVSHWTEGRGVRFSYASPHTFTFALCANGGTRPAPPGASKLVTAINGAIHNYTPGTARQLGGQTSGSKACVTPPPVKPSRLAESLVNGRETLNGQ